MSASKNRRSHRLLIKYMANNSIVLANASRENLVLHVMERCCTKAVSYTHLSAFKDSGGGVSSWINETIGPKVAYYAGWTYWACHITYIASKGSGGLKALSWAVFRNAETYDTFPTIYVQLGTLAVFLFFCWVASRGLNPLKKLATVAGSSMFIMSILYIIMMLSLIHI